MHHLHSNVYNIYQNIFFIFLCLGHSVGDTFVPILGWFALNLIIFEPLVSALYHIFFKNQHLGHYLYSYVYKIKSKHFLRFLMPWSHRERRNATILRHFAPNLIIFEPLVSAIYNFFSKTNIWGIISISLYIRSSQNIFFVILCLGHSVSDTLTPFLVDLGQIWSFLDRWFQLNKNFT